MQDSWLTNIVSGEVIIVVGSIAFFATRRWGWRAWPILLLCLLLVPLLSYGAVLLPLYYIDLEYGLAGGFVFHLNWLIMMVLGPSIIGSGLGLALRQRRAKGS